MEWLWWEASSWIVPALTELLIDTFFESAVRLHVAKRVRFLASFVASGFTYPARGQLEDQSVKGPRKKISVFEVIVWVWG